LKSISIAYLVKEYGEMVNEFGTELEVCFKCEEYGKVFNTNKGLLSRLKEKIGDLINERDN